MAATHLSGPLFVGGVPVLPGTPDPRNIRGQVGAGRVIYVGNAGVVGDGTSADAPLASLFGASGALSTIAGRTNSGDVIYVLPGHAENVSAADMGSHMTTASGFSIVGLGTGTMRPAFTWTAATATLLLDTANVEIANCQLFLAGSTSSTTALSVAAPITVSAAGCRIVNCYINYGVDADQLATIAITTTAAADNFEFIGNYCVAATGSVNTTFLRLVGVDNGLIAGNYIRGETSVATVGSIQCLTTASTNLRLIGNFVANMKSDATIAFTPMTATTGIAAYNLFYVDGTGILPITAGLMEWFQNYAINDQGEAGALVGTASA